MQSDSLGQHNPLTPMLREVFDSLMRSVMVCLPGKVLAFNPATQFAQVECGIQRVVDGRGVTIPVIENVPVHFAGDGEWYVWHQVKPGTEGLIHFSQRAVDTWLDQGGPVQPHDTRMFDAADAFFVPGVRSRPRAIPNFPNAGIGLSSYDGATRIQLTSGVITLTAGGSVATLNANGWNVNGPGFTHNSINVGRTHSHPQAPDSGGHTQPNTGAPL